MVPRIVTAPSRDLDLVSTLLAQAFADDPVTRWVNPDPSADKLLFATLVRWVHGPAACADVAFLDGSAVGAAVWDPPGARMSPRQQFGSVWGFVRALRGKVRRGMILETEFAKHRPKEPHWYLGQVGAAVHGMGVGTALLTTGVDRVDGPAYLESSNEVNIPLYERFGFEVTAEVTLPFDGPRVWPMYRRG
ncbi:GNAT family N-acetyltransferase [Gordonia sp. CPCC 206044]|uniref:GNAT family N-acetyltransferase n=1 Tax=Gordonia sp. CPCC 206044 TaxID=3140793 RepID=UPI003AF3890C